MIVKNAEYCILLNIFLPWVDEYLNRHGYGMQNIKKFLCKLILI